MVSRPAGADDTGERPAREVILASASGSRAHLLGAAGVAHRVVPANIDEAEIKLALRRERAPAFAIAETLAELKAQQVSQRHAAALVIGADQVLECGGELFDKPVDLAHARAHLTALRGRSHRLLTGVCVVRDGGVIWHHNDRAELEMRAFSDAFMDWYLDRLGERACRSVGAYQLEGLGAQLFSRVRGDYFSVLGLPLLPLLGFLREHGVELGRC